MPTFKVSRIRYYSSYCFIEAPTAEEAEEKAIEQDNWESYWDNPDEYEYKTENEEEEGGIK